ncbi:MAG: hypothetical protein EAZ31_11215 [Cytophagia bacterium]|nr:MAG: hypothetical protein EAZ31_11215 [Cytophagia bacterium]
MKVTERRLVYQYWHEMGWGGKKWQHSFEWEFEDGEYLEVFSNETSWKIVEILKKDKNGNPVLGIAERVVEI